MLSGMPGLISNPINKNPLSSIFIVSPYSTYINYKLNNDEYNKINEFINNNNSNAKSTKRKSKKQVLGMLAVIVCATFKFLHF